jgi:two-component system LytT family sensor kinase
VIECLFSPSQMPLVVSNLAAIGLLVVFVFCRAQRRRWLHVATCSTLWLVSLATPALEDGLSKASAGFMLPYLRCLLDTNGLTISDASGTCLGWDGGGERHAVDVQELARRAAASGRPQVASHAGTDCGDVECTVRGIVVVPLEGRGRTVGALGALSSSTVRPPLIQATSALGHYLSAQLYV